MEKNVPLYSLLGLIVVLLLISIAIQLDNSEENLTAWATMNSKELHIFIKDCHDNDGKMEVRPEGKGEIVFVCKYADKWVERTLRPAGKYK